MRAMLPKIAYSAPYMRLPTHCPLGQNKNMRLLTVTAGAAWWLKGLLIAAADPPYRRSDGGSAPARPASRERPPSPVYGRRAQQQQTAVSPAGSLDAIVAGAKRGEDGNTRLRHDLIRGHDGDFDFYHYDKVTGTAVSHHCSLL